MTGGSIAIERRPADNLVTILAAPAAGSGVELHWLGQAGFLIRGGDRMLAIDPYLSDSLADKYRGSETPHERMMPAPISTVSLGGLDLVLITHGHTDHMDPGTLEPLFKSNNHVRAIAPLAERERAIARGVPPDRLTGVDAGEIVTDQPFTVTAIAAAHETLDRDDAGHHRFLGYVIDAAGVRIYHSGDCVPYPGLIETLAPQAIDIALLPVNGRRPELTKRGIAGNFTAAEAAQLCVSAGIPRLIGHHYGMFAFNTVAPSEARDAFRQHPLSGGAELAEIAVNYAIGRPAARRRPSLSAWY